MGNKSLRERLQDRQKDLKNRGDGYKMFVVKEGTTRFRIAHCGEDNDWALEVTVFYLGKDLGFVVSPSTFGEKCAILKTYNELKDGSESDRQFAAKFKPGKKFIVPAFRYTDEDGSEVDTKNGIKPLMLAPSAYNQALDLWLDKENGDFTNPGSDGYDLKFKRSGKGKNDTEYSVVRCKCTKAPKGLRGPVNLEELVRSIIPTYKETKEMMEKYLNLAPEEDTEDAEEQPKKKKKKKDSGDL